MQLLQSGEYSSKLQKQKIRKIKNALRQRLSYLHERIANAIFGSRTVRHFKKHLRVDQDIQDHNSINNSSQESPKSNQFENADDSLSEDGKEDRSDEEDGVDDSDTDFAKHDDGNELPLRGSRKSHSSDMLIGDDLHSLKFGQYGFLIQSKYCSCALTYTLVNIRTFRTIQRY
jgi:hypothetical protein